MRVEFLLLLFISFLQFTKASRRLEQSLFKLDKLVQGRNAVRYTTLKEQIIGVLDLASNFDDRGLVDAAAMFANAPEAIKKVLPANLDQFVGGYSQLGNVAKELFENELFHQRNRNAVDRWLVGLVNMWYDRLESYDRKLRSEYIPWILKLSLRWPKNDKLFDQLREGSEKTVKDTQTLLELNSLIKLHADYIYQLCRNTLLEKIMPVKSLEGLWNGKGDQLILAEKFLTWLSRAFAIMDYGPETPLFLKADQLQVQPGSRKYKFTLPFDATLMESWEGYQQYLNLGGNSGQVIIAYEPGPTEDQHLWHTVHRKQQREFEVFSLRLSLAFKYGFVRAFFDPSTMTFSWKDTVRIYPYSTLPAHPCTRKECSVKSCNNRCLVCFSYYCSSACQKLDWKSHKPHCTRPVLTQIVVKIHSATGKKFQIGRNRKTDDLQIYTGNEADEFPYLEMFPLEASSLEEYS